MLGRRSIHLALLCASAGGPSLASAAAPGPEPSAPPPQRIEEQGESPYYYRRPDDAIGAGIRTSIGPRISLASTVPRKLARFSLDVLPAVDFGFTRGARVGGLVEGGYSYSRDGLHLFVLGAGPVRRAFGPKLDEDRGQMHAALVPHGVVGTLRGELAYGVRTSVIFHFFLAGIEVGHQYVVSGQQRGHELRLMLSFGALGMT